MKSSKDDIVIIEIVLGRRLLGTFMTIYMPTILLNIISFNTNYLKSIFFEAILTVNLTVKSELEHYINNCLNFLFKVMLVLTTMFVGVCQTLPHTSTIKMVDIWLVFNLLIPFIEVLIHTYKVIFQKYQFCTLKMIKTHN